MILLYTDETNLDPNQSDYFIYGGVAIPSINARALSDEIERIRIHHGYNPLDDLKFNSTGRPLKVSVHSHIEVKKEILKIAAELNVKIFISLIHHGIAKSPNEARIREINRICYHFNCFLNQESNVGLVLLDTFSDNQLRNILKEKFMIGITGLPYSDKLRLDKILGFHLASIGSSHFSSLVDIAIGTFRYCINNKDNESKKDSISKMLPQIKKLFILSKEDNVKEISLFFSPKIINVEKYLKEYISLHAFLQSHGISADQVPTNERTY